MTNDNREHRMDHLLQRALETGDISVDATEDERAELEVLLAGAEHLANSRRNVTREADSARPVAKARFERFMQEQQPSNCGAHAPAPAAAAGWRRFFGGRTALGALATAAVVVLAALVVVPALFQDVDTASAQVLEPGDYVQVTGVVSAEPGADALELQSPFGPVTIAFGDTSEVVDGEDRLHPSQLGPGDEVTVDGIVGEDRRVRATTLARAARGATPPPERPIERLRDFREGLEGRVVSFALSEGSSEGRVLIETPRGDRVLVDVDAVTVERLLNAGDAAVGLSIRIERPVESERRFQALPIATPPGGGQAPFLAQGQITAAADGTLAVESLRGSLRVRVTEATRIATGASGLTREDFLTGSENVIGQRIAVSGRVDAATGALEAHVIVVGDGERGRRR